MRLAFLQPAKRIALLITLALATISLTGCQIIAGTGQYTQIRFLDASPDAPGLDVYQNSIAALYNVGFGTASSYIPVTPASYSYAVDAAGTRQQLATVSGALAAGSQYTLLVGNLAANLQMTLLKDQSTPAPSGQVAMRFLDQSTRTGAIDIYLVPANGTLGNTSPLLTKVAFNNTAAYLNIPSGTYSIVIVPTPTLTSTVPAISTISTLYSGNQVIYSGTSARTIVLIDQPLSTSAALQLITADDYDSPAIN